MAHHKQDIHFPSNTETEVYFALKSTSHNCTMDRTILLIQCLRTLVTTRTAKTLTPTLTATRRKYDFFSLVSTFLDFILFILYLNPDEREPLDILPDALPLNYASKPLINLTVSPLNSTQFVPEEQ